MFFQGFLSDSPARYWVYTGRTRFAIVNTQKESSCINSSGGMQLLSPI